MNISTFTGSPSSFARSTSLFPEIARRKSSAKEVVTVTESWRALIYVCGPTFTVAMTEVLGDGVAAGATLIGGVWKAPLPGVVPAGEVAFAGDVAPAIEAAPAVEAAPPVEAAPAGENWLDVDCRSAAPASTAVTASLSLKAKSSGVGDNA